MASDLPDGGRHEGRTGRPKTLLYCPECPHESPIAGDWRVVEARRGVRYVCPECGTTIARRGAPPGGHLE